MKNYNVNNAQPSAFIVNSNDRGRKKIYLNSKVYLGNNSEFQIELLNPLQDSVLTEIKINGKIASANGLILKPGQRFFLDCSIDDKRKFIFKTYEIENTNESLNATANNGFVEVSFFKEKTHYNNYYNGTLTIPNWTNGQWSNGQWSNGQWSNGQWLGGSATGLTTTSINGLSNTSIINNCNSFNSCHSNTSTIGLGSFSLNEDMKVKKMRRSVDRTETGRIEKGETSTQKFESLNMEFETYCINRVSYQILPESKKPVETSEIKKNFCIECGHKLKGSERFCPSCGTKI